MGLGRGYDGWAGQQLPLGLKLAGGAGCGAGLRPCNLLFDAEDINVQRPCDLIHAVVEEECRVEEREGEGEEKEEGGDGGWLRAVGEEAAGRERWSEGTGLSPMGWVVGWL